MYYERLETHFQGYVDRLLAHARRSLWPERRQAMESFRRGIAGAEEADLEASLQALGDLAPRHDDPATALYRTLLTAYLERLDECDEISNPDQAALLCESLDGKQAERAQRWLEAHPQHVSTAQAAERQ